MARINITSIIPIELARSRILARKIGGSFFLIRVDGDEPEETGTLQERSGFWCINLQDGEPARSTPLS